MDFRDRPEPAAPTGEIRPQANNSISVWMPTQVRLKKNTQKALLQPKNRAAANDLLVVLAIVVFVLAFFGKTLIEGQPLSRICNLADWDSLFSTYRSGTSTATDPSLVQLLVPYHFLVAKLWHGGQLPLWNPFNACGVPLLGDIQSGALSPFSLVLALCPTMYAYNVSLVLKVAVAALGAFALARCLALGRWASVFASLTFAFAPFCLWSLELITPGYCFHPVVYLCFVRAAQRPSLARSWFAGAACALLVLSGHPEVSFFGILLACLLMALMVLWPGSGRLAELAADQTKVADGGDASHSTALARRLLSVIAIVATAGISAFCLAAPVLLPFGEYLVNADCYKFQGVAGFLIPWQKLTLNLINPGSDNGSSYLGCLVAILLPVAFTVGRPAARQILVLLFVSFLLACRLPPMSFVATLPPLSYLHPKYCLTDFLLLAAVAAAFGLDELIGRKTLKLTRAWWVAMVAAVLVALLPLYLLKAPAAASLLSLDSILKPLSVSTHAWKRDVFVACVVIVVAGAAQRLRFFPLFLAGALCIVLGFFSEASVFNAVLPAQARFDYHWVQPLPLLKDSGERSIAMGAHLLKPNTGAVYGVSDLRVHNPLFPRRYLTFMRKAGASVDSFNQTFEHSLSSLLDVAAVRYVLSLLPVRFERDPPAVYTRPDAVDEDGISFGPDIHLRSVAMSYQSEHAEVCGRLEFEARVSDRRRYSYSLVWLDDAENVVWFGDQNYFARAPGGSASAPDVPTKVVREFAVPVSLATKPGARLSLALQVFDWKSIKFLKPSSSLSKRHEDIAILSGITVLRRPEYNADGAAGGRQLQLLSETPHGVRIYRNEAAVPRAHIVHDAVYVASEMAALQAIQNPGFNPLKQAVVEASPDTIPLRSLVDARNQSNQPDRASIERSGVNEVSVKVELATPGLLVLADTYYPGWIAKLDGKDVPIWRANYLFRGVVVPAGLHHVEFRYVPFSFWLGVAMFACCLVGGVLAFLADRRKVQF